MCVLASQTHGLTRAGHYIPRLGARIIEYATVAPRLQLAGLGLGNCWVDSFSQTSNNGIYLCKFTIVR